MAFLEFTDIDKSFGTNHVISKFNLKVEKGKFLVLLGPSGCGKSTLLRMIAGLEKIDKGKIILENNHLNNLLPSRRQIAMVFQSYALYPHMNVFQNISFGLISEKIDKDEMNRKVIEAARILKIEELLDRKPKELSGGQRQRVAIARALVNSPSIILADEPTGNLDSKSGHEIMSILDRLHQEGNTIILVTHEDDIAQHAHRMVRLFDGKIIEDSKI